METTPAKSEKLCGVMGQNQQNHLSGFFKM